MQGCCWLADQEMMSLCNPSALFLLLLEFMPSVSFDHFTHQQQSGVQSLPVPWKSGYAIFSALALFIFRSLPVSAAPLELKSNLATQQPNLIHSLIKNYSAWRRYRAKSPLSPRILTRLRSHPTLISVNTKQTHCTDIPVNPELNR